MWAARAAWISALALVASGTCVVTVARGLRPKPHRIADVLVDLVPSDERVLADAWAAHHPDEPPPTCAPGIGDPLVTLDADLDDAPGTERVLAAHRFGVVMAASSTTCSR